MMILSYFHVAILCLVFGVFFAGSMFFFRRYRAAQKNWDKVSEKLREAIELSSSYRQIISQILDKYPDALPHDWE